MNDDTAPAELAWENEGGHVLRMVAGTPSSPRATTARVGRIPRPAGRARWNPGAGRLPLTARHDQVPGLSAAFIRTSSASDSPLRALFGAPRHPGPVPTRERRAK